MQKIISVSVPDYRSLRVMFADGTDGILHIDDDFTGIAQPLTESHVFASARIIDNGYAIGFEGCEYDICSTWIYQQIAPSVAAAIAVLSNNQARCPLPQ